MSKSAKYHEAIAKQANFSQTEQDEFLDGVAEENLNSPGSANPFTKDSPSYWGFIAGSEDRNVHHADVAGCVEIVLRDRGEPSYSAH